MCGKFANRRERDNKTKHHTHTLVQPIPLEVTISKAHSSKLEQLFCHVSVKRDFRALSFRALKQHLKMSPQVGLAVPFSLSEN